MRISDWSSDVCSSDLLLRAEATLAECAVPTAVPRLDIVPAIVDLSGAEIELVEFQDRLHRLQKALASAEAGQWDICLIDCPPSLGMLTLNALIAAETLLVPLQCEFFALEGLSQLLTTVERVRGRFNRSEEHTSELQSLMRLSYAVFCLKKKT